MRPESSVPAATVLAHTADMYLLCPFTPTYTIKNAPHTHVTNDSKPDTLATRCQTKHAQARISPDCFHVQDASVGAIVFLPAVGCGVRGHEGRGEQAHLVGGGILLKNERN